MRLIDADALKKALNYVYYCEYIENKSKEGIASDIIEEIDNAPTVDVEKIKSELNPTVTCWYDFDRGYEKGYEKGKSENLVDHEIKFKAIRVYQDGHYKSGSSDWVKATSELDQAFEQGWHFVRASEYIPDTDKTCGYIEYILMKSVD